jgi:hypothetical protein
MNWHPMNWFTTQGTVGVDVLSSQRYAFVRPGDQPDNFLTRTGAVEDTRTRQTATTADLSASAIARDGRLSSRTAIGAQYARNLYSGSGAFGTNLAPGASTPATAAIQSARESYRSTVVLGSYVEEMVGLNDRAYLTGALRVDGASSFGRNYDAAVYPKVSASWLISGEPFMPRIAWLNEVRLRYAFGASGTQPDPAWARPNFVVTQVDLNGQRVNAYRLPTVGNPALGPERVREHEFGADVSVFQQRLSAQFTGFSRRTTGQIVSVPQASGLGFLFQNLGLTTQSGAEVRLDAHIIDARAMKLDIAFQHSNYKTLLKDLGTATPGRREAGGYVEGYPLGARFARPIIGFADTNGDGILAFNELKYSDSLIYVGNSRPTQSQNLSANIGLLNGSLRLSTLLERRAGFSQSDQVNCQEGFSACRELVQLGTPLDAQARALSAFLPQPAHFVRLREVAMSYDVPQQLIRIARLRTATVSVSGRNLRLWSNFTGPDPEAGDPDGFNLFAPGIAGGSASGLPMAKSFSVRLDLGF